MCIAFDKNAIDKAKESLAHDLSLMHAYNKETKLFQTRACITCDRLLRWNEQSCVSQKRLISLKDKLEGDKLMKKELRKQYRYMGKGHTAEMKSMLLSPRAVFVHNIDPCALKAKPGFQCCSDCFAAIGNEEVQANPNRLELHEFAIANGMTIGEAPKVLLDLNPMELALVSQARIDKHVFSFYGGCHQSIKGWHSMFEADVEHTAGVLQRLDDMFGSKVTIACCLQGPFTKRQKELVKKKCEIEPKKVLAAMNWLIDNNDLWKGFKIPDPKELPKAIILDDSEHCHSANTAIEEKFEYTVVFPDTEDTQSTNGGFDTFEEFQQNVVDQMAVEATLVSCPTQNRLKDYEGDALLRAFPLQFPYGYGAYQKRNAKDGEESKLKAHYLKHLLRLSLPQMHQGPFILVTHNIYERNRASTLAYLRCIHRDGDLSAAEAFSQFGISDVQQAINRKHSNIAIRDKTMSRFVSSLEACCKHMGHTNEAAKSARLKVFALNAAFGIPAVFFTVTPDDSNGFRITINGLNSAKLPEETIACFSFPRCVPFPRNCTVYVHSF